ncbi:MAG: DUF4058 family protein [Candidatus Tectomicrobia bacterium]|uniref:DUF4058 family protein n=1 Tax=Tectimicrobiota bacterium TaxID=2528274 RepID=A0A937W1U3_UNCTE|nr:DUF4058 family protein [Candidatus Tectomicrobia bacterium]
MPSPFPGMDPYLEGYLWPDVHQALASKLRQQLAPVLRPRYTARLAVSVVEDSAPEHEIGIMYPDVEVLEANREEAATPLTPGEQTSHPGATPALLKLPVLMPVEVRLISIEIRDTAQHRLVTGIEILSPVNKREPGLTTYRQKRQRLSQAGVHLLELDLLRRGTRPLMHPRLPHSHYLITLLRQRARCIEVWPWSVQEPFPYIPVPLLPPDEDVILNLPAAFTAVYDEAAYDLSLDYTQPPPPPPFAEDEQQWMRGVCG